MTKDELERIQALEDERVRLIKAQQALQLQLSQKRLYSGNAMLSPVQYNQKQDAAKRRMGELLPRLTQVNADLKKLRSKRNETLVAAMGVDAKDPLSLIAHGYNLLHRLACEGVELDPQEQAVLDGMRHYLAHHRG